MTKAQDGGFIWHGVYACIQTDKVPIGGHVMQGFFNCGIRQTKPLLQEEDAQHNGQARWGSAALGARLAVVRGYELLYH